MRISDWSLDVCSSDLLLHLAITLSSHSLVLNPRYKPEQRPSPSFVRIDLQHLTSQKYAVEFFADTVDQPCVDSVFSKYLAARSEERRVGKACVSTCRSRWWPYH